MHKVLAPLQSRPTMPGTIDGTSTIVVSFKTSQSQREPRDLIILDHYLIDVSNAWQVPRISWSKCLADKSILVVQNRCKYGGTCIIAIQSMHPSWKAPLRAPVHESLYRQPMWNSAHSRLHSFILSEIGNILNASEITVARWFHFTRLEKYVTSSTGTSLLVPLYKITARYDLMTIYLSIVAEMPGLGPLQGSTLYRNESSSRSTYVANFRHSLFLTTHIFPVYMMQKSNLSRVYDLLTKV